MKKNEKGFALVLSLVLLLVMSLMGGALIVISSGDHKNNNLSDKYQQAFYVAETGLLEGEKYVMNQFLGPYTADGSTRLGCLETGGTDCINNGDTRDRQSRNLPGNKVTLGNTDCSSSFPDLDRKESDSAKTIPTLKIVAQDSNNFGTFIATLIRSSANAEKEKKFLDSFEYEYFVLNVGAAPYRGYGSSIKKGATDEMSDGMAYRVYSCGMYKVNTRDEIIVPLESVIVLAN